MLNCTDDGSSGYRNVYDVSDNFCSGRNFDHWAVQRFCFHVPRISICPLSIV